MVKKLFRRLFPSKERRAYNKMHRKHRKELIQHAKKTCEWDWLFLHDSIIMQIRHMHEYYTANNNVWQTDESRLPIIEQLQHILDLNAEIDRGYENDCGVEFIHKDGKLEAIFPDDYSERVTKFANKEQKLYEELYGSIGKNLRWWWD